MNGGRTSGWAKGYPPGVHTVGKNKDLSMVGDFTRMMREVAVKKPFWMTLQIAFSGVVKPGKTLRMPTFPEQRFMAYEAIINGSRGLTYFGGGLPQTLNERDKPLGLTGRTGTRSCDRCWTKLAPNRRSSRR